jgi:hypothetical protein
MRREQKAWLKSRDSECGRMKTRAFTLSCLGSRYKSQIARLADKNLLVCGAPREEAGKISLICDAVNNSARQSLTLAGHSTSGDLEVVLDSLTVRSGTMAPQTIKLADAKINKSGLQATPQDVVELVDVNFDGFDDIKLWTSTSAGPNNGYSYWLFDSKSQRFQPSDLGDKLSGFDISFDAATRTIQTSGRASCCEWERVVYRWAGGQLRIMTIATDRVSPYRIPPLEKLDVELCASQTDHYNEREELVSNDIGPCETDVLPGEMKRAAFTALLQKNPKGYSVLVKDKDHLTITYNKPVPGHAEP